MEISIAVSHHSIASHHKKSKHDSRSFAPDKCCSISPLSVTLTVDLKTWTMPEAILFIVVKIFIKCYKNSSLHVGDMLQTKSGYFIIFWDIKIAYIDLNFMCHSQSNDNDLLCYNPCKG
jgi:hypothetical protein